MNSCWELISRTGFKMQHFNYFLTLFLHLIFSALSLYKWEPMAQNHKVILYLDSFFSPIFILCTKLNPPDVQIQPTVCVIQDHFLHLLSHHFLSLVMVKFLTVPFPSFMPGKCTSEHHYHQCTYSQSSDVWESPSHQWDISQAPGVSSISYTIWTKLCRWCKKSCSTLCVNLMKTYHLLNHL